MTYNEWEQEQNISPSSPEAYYAELAWNAAFQLALSFVHAGAKVEKDVIGLAVLLDEEFTHLDTGLRGAD